MSTIYGVDANTLRGKAMLELLRGRYNEERFVMSGNTLERETSDVVMTCSLTGGRFLQSDSYSGPLQRPIIHAKASVDMADGMIAGQVTRLGFLQGESPSFDYYHSVSDDDMKKLIDSGLYSNPRFEAIFDKLLQDESFDLSKDLSYYHIEFEDEDGVPVPIIIADVEDLDIEDIRKGASLRLDTFSDVIISIAEVVKEMEKAGVTQQVLGDDYDTDAVVSVSDQLEETTLLDEAEIKEASEAEITKEDEVVTVDKELNDSALFGETSEEAVIAEVKRQRTIAEEKAKAEAEAKARLQQEREDAEALEAMMGSTLTLSDDSDEVVDISQMNVSGGLVEDVDEEELEV